MEEPKDKVVTAWYTPEIPVSLGPANYWGLPGLILEININENASTIIAESIKLNTLPVILRPKSKGKMIAHQEYRKLIKTYIEDCIERRRNPYWDLRY